MRLLVLYHAGFTHTPTIFHYLDAFRRYSGHQVEFFNIDQKYDEPLDFSEYDALFVNFCVVSVARVDPPAFFLKLLPAIANFRGTKIVAIQDEYDFTNAIKRFVRLARFDVVLTCIPEAAVRSVYFEPQFAETRFETVLTAYVAEELAEASDDILPLADRQIPLGYRGRELPYRLGDLGWHKAEIGHRFNRACADRGVRCNIAVDEDSRFQGDNWIRFVRRCRVMLGTPSGANVFDFDGSLHESMKLRYQRNNALKYADVRDQIAKHTVDFDMGQISARVFEAAASRTALAMLRGSYSGVLDPVEHYVPIETDYSNIDQVIDRIQDLPAMQAMADRTYDHVIGNPANHYAGFIARIDRLVDEMARPREQSFRPSQLRVTASPLGNDPYMVEKLMELRKELREHVAGLSDVIRAAAERRLDVVKHHDGTYRVLKFAGAQR